MSCWYRRRGKPTMRPRRTHWTPSVFKAVEALTKGIEMQLPDGLWYLDKDGQKRVSGQGSVVECQCRDLPPDRATWTTD